MHLLKRIKSFFLSLRFEVPWSTNRLFIHLPWEDKKCSVCGKVYRTPDQAAICSDWDKIIVLYEGKDN